MKPLKWLQQFYFMSTPLLQCYLFLSVMEKYLTEPFEIKTLQYNLKQFHKYSIHSNNTNALTWKLFQTNREIREVLERLDFIQTKAVPFELLNLPKGSRVKVMVVALLENFDRNKIIFYTRRVHQGYWEKFGIVSQDFNKDDFRCVRCA